MIDDAVVLRYLRARQFNHDARSIHSLVRTSNLRTAVRYEVEDLPLEGFLRHQVSEDFGFDGAATHEVSAEDARVHDVIFETMLNFGTHAGAEPERVLTKQHAQWIVSELRAMGLQITITTDGGEHEFSGNAVIDKLADSVITCGYFNALSTNDKSNSFVKQWIPVSGSSLAENPRAGLTNFFTQLSTELSNQGLVISQTSDHYQTKAN